MIRIHYVFYANTFIPNGTNKRMKIYRYLSTRNSPIVFGVNRMRRVPYRKWR